MKPDWRRIPVSQVKPGQNFTLYPSGALFRSTGKTKYMEKEIHVFIEQATTGEQLARALPHDALVWAEIMEEK